MHHDPVLDAFARQLRRRPEAPLVVSRRRRATVADVDRLARAMTEPLAAAGLARGSLVGLAAANGPAFLAGLLAIRRAGGVALLLGARTPEAERRRVVRDLGAAAVLVCSRAWPQLADDVALLPGTEGKPAILEPDVAVVKLTSGTTGRPRGILTPAAALVADDAALAATMGLVDDERILATIPMSHSYGLSSVVMPALMRGSVLVLAGDRGALDPMSTVRTGEVTFLPTAPAVLQALVRMSSPPPAPSSLRLVITAGAPLEPATATRFREIYGRPVRVFYGASECGGIAFDRDGGAGERGGLGTPVEGVSVELMPVPGGEAGRGTVTVRSPAVARGYYPEPDPSLEDGVFRTRDLAVWRDGELYLEGRLDDLINVRGKKVDPREVDAVLARLDGVEDVATLGVVPPGRDQPVVRSFVVCRPGRLSYETVQAWCRRHLAEHKVPRSIVFLPELPRTPRGKLDRAALLRL